MPQALTWGHRRAIQALAAFAVLVFLAVPQAAQATLSAQDATAYRSAFEAADGGRWTLAFQHASAARDGTLAEVLRWMHLREASNPYGFSDYVAFLNRNPNWPAQAQLQRRAEEVMAGASAAQVVAWFERYPPITGTGWMLHAEALMSLGRQQEAQSIARTAWRESSFGRADERRFLARFSSSLTREDHHARVDRLLWDRDTEAAQRLLTHVSDGTRALANARIALITQGPGVDSALARVPASLQNDPGLTYDRLRWRREKGMESRAAELLSSPGVDQGRADLWWRERVILARAFMRDGNHRAAYRAAAGTGERRGGNYADGEWLAGWIALRFLNDAPTARQHFTRLYENVGTPISLSRAAYWAGRAEEATGNTAEARRWYALGAEHSTTYYGQLAAGRLVDPNALTFPDSPPVLPEDRAALQNNPLLPVVSALAALGREDELRLFMTRLFQDAQTPGQQRLVAEQALDLGRLELAVALSRRAAQAGVHLMEAGYPVPPLDRSGGVVPERALVLSIIRQESNFHTNAISHAGAMGLMQVMPATARQVARQLGESHSDSRLTADPDYNMRLGSSYLAGLLDRFSGSYPLSIAAYNAGPGRPVEWLRRNGDPRQGGQDWVDWVESIPFYETRNYVQRVLEGVQVYRHRLGQEVAYNIEDDLRR